MTESKHVLENQHALRLWWARRGSKASFGGGGGWVSGSWEGGFSRLGSKGRGLGALSVCTLGANFCILQGKRSWVVCGWRVGHLYLTLVSSVPATCYVGTWYVWHVNQLRVQRVPDSREARATGRCGNCITCVECTSQAYAARVTDT